MTPLLGVDRSRLCTWRLHYHAHHHPRSHGDQVRLPWHAVRRALARLAELVLEALQGVAAGVLLAEVLVEVAALEVEVVDRHHQLLSPAANSHLRCSRDGNIELDRALWDCRGVFDSTLLASEQPQACSLRLPFDLVPWLQARDAHILRVPSTYGI